MITTEQTGQQSNHGHLLAYSIDQTLSLELIYTLAQKDLGEIDFEHHTLALLSFLLLAIFDLKK